MNEIYLEEKEGTDKETQKKFTYIALIWRIGSQTIQLKPVFNSDKGAIKILAGSGMVKFKKLNGVK